MPPSRPRSPCARCGRVGDRVSGERVRLPRTYRPLGTRIVSAAGVVVIVTVVAMLWALLPGHAKAGFGWPQRVTVVFFFGGMVVGLYALFRTSVRADRAGLTVVNGYRRHRYEWAQVLSVSLPPNRPFALVDLSDGTTISAMALQASDGERATRQARELAAVIAEQSGFVG